MKPEKNLPVSKFTIQIPTQQFTEKQYYSFWPNSLYNNDLEIAKNITINYLKYHKQIDFEIIDNKDAIILDLDDTILFGDPCRIVGITEIEESDDIFILPINKEIKELIDEAKKLGFIIIIWTARPSCSKKATIENLKRYNIQYDLLVTNDDDEYENFKATQIKKLNEIYNIICTIGDQEFDCFEPFAIKLPDEENRYISLYCEYGPEFIHSLEIEQVLSGIKINDLYKFTKNNSPNDYMFTMTNIFS
jgi:hypothetical protein